MKTRRQTGRDAEEAAGDHDQRLAEDRERQEADPELAPPDARERDRRGAERPPRAAFEADRGEHEADGDRCGDERGEAEVGEGDDLAERAGERAPVVDRQRREVVDVDDHEREQQQELRPLARVAEEDRRVLHEEQTCGVGQGTRRGGRASVPRTRSRSGPSRPSCARDHAVRNTRSTNARAAEREHGGRARQQRQMKERVAALDRRETASSTFAAHVVGRYGEAGASKAARNAAKPANSDGLARRSGRSEPQRQIAAGDQCDARHDEHVAHAPRGKHQHEDRRQRDAERGGNGQERDQGRERREVVERPGVVDDAVGEEDRKAEEQHHPRRRDQRLDEARLVEAPARHRRDQQEAHVGREIDRS